MHAAVPGCLRRSDPAPTEALKVEEPPKEEAPKEETSKDPDPVTIRFWQAGGDTVGASTVMRMLLDEFEDLYPWITVEYQAIPWSNDPHVQFQTGIADVLVVGSPLDFQLSNEGALLPLDDLLDPSVKADISEVLLNECIYSGTENPDMTGKIMSLPLYTGTDSDAWRKGIEDYLKFYTEGLPPAGSVAMDGATLFNMFANGEVAMLCGADILVVPNKGEDTQTEAAADPYFSEDFVQAGFAATTAGAHYFGNYGVPGVGTILKANIQMLINGEVTMDEYIENVTAEIQTAIDETYG